MDKFKIGDVVYHKAGNTLLGTICGFQEDKVTVRKVETLLEVQMYPQELKTQEEVEQERKAMAEQVNQINRANAKKISDRYGL